MKTNTSCVKMDLKTSHLAAALMAGPNHPSYKDVSMDCSTAAQETTKQDHEGKDQHKAEPEEEKEEAGSGEDFSDEEGDSHGGSKTKPGRGVTIQMLMDEKMLQPGIGVMTIEYLGQKFVADLQTDGKIKSHETETIFCSPSAWAIHCKRIINPEKRSGCGWASVKYKGKKLDTIKGTYLRRKQLQRESMHSDEENEAEAESPPEPPPQRIVMKHNTVPNRMMQHDANMLIEAVSFSSIGKVQPFLVSISTNAYLVLDLHCHLKIEEVYGYLAGTWDLNSHNILITHTFPCLISKKDSRPSVFVELEIQMEIEKLGLSLVGWYHSHPTNPAMPSLRDCDNQLEYQIRMRGPSEISYTPCVGVICSPYNPDSPVLESSLTCFWVTPPPEQRPTEYPRPLLMQYTMMNETHLSSHAMDQIKKSIKYYSTMGDEAFVMFKDNFKPDITYLDKLKCTLSSKFPREQSDGLLWHFIRDELGCSSDQDDKMDLDALLAVPQPIPSSKPSQQPIIPNIPSVSTLQQMVSRPVGVPPIVSTGSSHKFEMPASLNIPTPSTSSKSSKTSTSSLPPSFPSGLDMLTSMALGLTSSANMPLPLGGSLDSLTANSLLSGLPPGISTSLAASLTGGKLPDPPSYTASLQNLTSSIGGYDKPSTVTSSSASASNIPASIASNLMMSSADIANALFSTSKYSSAGLLGIPDPMSKQTLAANNMFLSPSLLKMQEALLKPLSSSSPISTKAGLDQSLLMKSPHDILKGAKDYLPPDFNLSTLKGKLNMTGVSETTMKQTEMFLSGKMDVSKSENMDTSDFDKSRSGMEQDFLMQVREYNEKKKKKQSADYSDYVQSSLKLSKPEDYSSGAMEQDVLRQMMEFSESNKNPPDYDYSQSLKLKKTEDYTSQDYDKSRAMEQEVLRQMMDFSDGKKMPDYSDYQSPLKLSKGEDYSSSMAASSHTYSSTSSIADTIAQVAMGNLPAQTESGDFLSDYSMPRTSSANEND